MRVRQVSLGPTLASLEEARPTLTPEMMAAVGARYSRNNEGLEEILSKVEHLGTDAAVDSIFKMVDYGHQSIADMATVAMFMDNISIWLAYYLWSVCPTASGQESSTRYVKMNEEGLVDPHLLGIPEESHEIWRGHMSAAFSNYQEALFFWEELGTSFPELTKIPKSLLEDPAQEKKVARMKRNYAFDRARYFIPVAAATNMMMVMTARNWVQLCQLLLSHQIPEAVALGKLIAEELSLVTPRLMKHATGRRSTALGIVEEFQMVAERTSDIYDGCHKSVPMLDVHRPSGTLPLRLAESLSFHENRYAWIGSHLSRTSVRFGWTAVTMGEIRDLNRHRTGTKFCPLDPVGFYNAQDQVPEDISLRVLGQVVGDRATRFARNHLKAGDPSYIFWTLLGTQFPFEHLTTGDKFVYEVELRTGVGAHFRYARHFHDLMELWYDKFPETKGLILEGSAEPE